MKKITFILMALISIIPNISLAHPGRTDSSGCHTCRTNCASWGLSTGEYHCHQSKGVTQPVEPVRSIRNENGIGTAVPAPEYKEPVVETIKIQTPTKTITTPTVKIETKPTTKTIPEIKKEEKQVVTPITKETSSTTTTNNYSAPEVKTKRPSLIKRFFNWLFQ